MTLPKSFIATHSPSINWQYPVELIIHPNLLSPVVEQTILSLGPIELHFYVLSLKQGIS